jgi:glutathione S-transferase
MTQASPLILHHYPTSPFAEKIRLLLAYKKLAWQSVMVPMIMPKPDVIALTGGYRRTPVLQIGADIYCDTALIAQVIEQLVPMPAVAGGPQSGIGSVLAHWADTVLFWTAVPFAFQPAALPVLFAGVPDEVQAAFGKDRAAMRPGIRRPALPELRADLLRYLATLEAQLSHGVPYLTGAHPAIADFSVYAPLWFVRRLAPVAAVLNPFPQLLAWMDRMAAIGQGEFSKLSGSDAIARAAAAAHVARAAAYVNSHEIALGSEVTITPTDYAFDAVQGTLVVCSEDELAVLRKDARAGEVVVHFPRRGYEMKVTT